VLDYHHVLSITVRPRDIDAWGHVNNAVYFTFMEMARGDYYSNVVLQTRFRNPGSIGVILAETSCRFIKPIFFDQRVQVGTRVIKMGESSLHVEHRIEADNELAALAKAISVFYDYQAGHSTPIPSEYRDRICAYEELAT
jgi:acyl-CoA thioester hydrolase